jgi:S1-C subfamily serine protease
VIALTLLLLLPGDIDTIESRDFPRAAQEAAVCATVRIVNARKALEGSGTIIKRGGPFVYLLTANHVVEGAEGLEVATFTARSYPRPENVYRSAEVLARSVDVDLALLRIATRDPLPGSIAVCSPKRVPSGQDFAGLAVGCSAGSPPGCVAEAVLGKKLVRKPGEDVGAWHWEVSKKTAKGHSGGPLLDVNGSLIGVASGFSGEHGYYVHVEEVHAFLRRNGVKWLYEEEEK